jgi:hypothetical protein
VLRALAGPADTSITTLPGTGAPTEFLIEIAYLLDSSEHDTISSSTSHDDV